MQFESRLALEAEIDVCSTRVRELQEFVRKSDGGVTLEQVAEQVKKLVSLRKELQLWKAKEEQEEEEAALAAEQQSNQHSDGAASPTSSSSGKKKRKKSKKKSAGAPSSPTAAEDADAAQAASSGDSSNESDEPVVEDVKGQTPDVEEPQQAAVEEASDNQADESIGTYSPLPLFAYVASSARASSD